jgi:hypothetical protein
MLDVVFAVCLIICVCIQFLSFRVPTNAVMTSRDLELRENRFVEEAIVPSQGTRQVFIVEDFSV